MKGSAAVVERLAATAPAEVALPQPVLAEIAFGIVRMPRSKPRAALRARFDLISSELPRATLVTAHLGHMIRVPGLRVEDWNR